MSDVNVSGLGYHSSWKDDAKFSVYGYTLTPTVTPICLYTVFLIRNMKSF